MAGKICPICGEKTFFENSSGRKCSKCGYSMVVPPNNGMGGKGNYCYNCNSYTVFNGKCSKCGAKYK